MASRFFIFVGHPRVNSLTHYLADQYGQGAEAGGAEVRRMNLHYMQFDMDLTYGYHQRKDLEPCLEEWRENVTWADHLAWFFPYWWGGVPAKMKGVIDRAFLPGFAMNYHENDPWWDKLLTGRSGDVIINSDTPGWYDSVINGSPGRKQVANLMMKFSGVKPVKTFQFGPVKGTPVSRFERWGRKLQARGAKVARKG